MYKFHGEGMIIRDLNDRAKEAFANSLIDIGVAIFKSIILTLMVLPATLIVKATIENNSSKISIIEILGSLSTPTYFVFLTLLSIAFFMGHSFRKEGIRLLNTIED